MTIKNVPQFGSAHQKSSVWRKNGQIFMLFKDMLRLNIPDLDVAYWLTVLVLMLKPNGSKHSCYVPCHVTSRSHVVYVHLWIYREYVTCFSVLRFHFSISDFHTNHNNERVLHCCLMNTQNIQSVYRLCSDKSKRTYLNYSTKEETENNIIVNWKKKFTFLSSFYHHLFPAMFDLKLI